MSQDKHHNLEDYESEDRKIRTNEWYKLTHVLLVLAVVFLLYIFQIQARFGWLAWVISLFVVSLTLSYFARKAFKQFIK